MKEVGKVKDKIKEILSIKTDAMVIKQSEGLIKHLEKRNHQNMYRYLEKIEDILNSPDFIGINPREKVTSLEYIKQYDDNVLVAVKLDKKDDYFYIATIHEVSDLKIKQRLKNGRLKCFDKSL